MRVMWIGIVVLLIALLAGGFVFMRNKAKKYKGIDIGDNESEEKPVNEESADEKEEAAEDKKDDNPTDAEENEKDKKQIKKTKTKKERLVTDLDYVWEISVMDVKCECEKKTVQLNYSFFTANNRVIDRENIYFIGFHEKCGLTVENNNLITGLSAYHGYIRYDNEKGKLIYVDCSAYGTTDKDGNAVKAAEITDGMLLRLGNVPIIFKRGKNLYAEVKEEPYFKADWFIYAYYKVSDGAVGKGVEVMENGRNTEAVYSDFAIAKVGLNYRRFVPYCYDEKERYEIKYRIGCNTECELCFRGKHIGAVHGYIAYDKGIEQLIYVDTYNDGAKSFSDSGADSWGKTNKNGEIADAVITEDSALYLGDIKLVFKKGVKVKWDFSAFDLKGAIGIFNRIKNGLKEIRDLTCVGGDKK